MMAGTDPRPGLELRTVEESDLPFLQQVYASTRMGELEATAWSDEQKQAFLQMQFQAQHSHYTRHYPNASLQVILLDGVPVGRFYLDEWRGEFRVVDIALLPEQRGQGIGTELLGQVMERAAATGKAVTIHVEQFNPALSLYRRLGFRAIEDKGVYWLMEWRPALK